MMNIILLSGGSGKRLWPLSNDIRSKQFIKIFRTEDEGYESMVQRVYRQICNVDSNAKVTIATSKSQVSLLHNQLGDNVGISIEPCRRDTFPAIVLAVAYLHDVYNISEDEVVVVCPVDPYVDIDYFQALMELSELAEKNEANLTLMGIEPTYPSEKYGYIMPVNKTRISTVRSFKEKPNKKTAEKYISEGALWNGGVFAFKISYILNIAKKQFGSSNYKELYAKYETLEKISFDYAVVEKENKIQVMRFAGKWKDLGTWNTLTEAMSEQSIGKVLMSETCKNSNVINELDIPILCTGLDNMVVSASPDGILVSSKTESSGIKSLVDKVDEEIRYAEKSWGEYRVLDVSNKSMTIQVILRAGHKMSYHSHCRRMEIWTVIDGTGMAIVDGKEYSVKPGDVISLPVGCWHTIIAFEDGIEIIEVQIGDDISVNDKQKNN